MGWQPDGGKPPARILLIQLRRIGDAVLLTPALDAIRTAWPDASVHLLTETPIPDLFRGDDRIQVLWPRPDRKHLPGLAAALRRERFDLCLDFQSLPWTALLARQTGAHAVGFAKRYRARAYHRAIRLEDHRGSDYAADHKLDLLRGIGLSPTLVPPTLVPPADSHSAWNAAEARPRVVLVPVSLRPHKRWSIEAFAATAKRIHEMTGAFVLLAGGPGESPVLTETAAHLTGIPHDLHCSRTLAEFASLLGGADLFLGNDNGPRHIALALGVPTLAYFGSQNPSHWTPPATDRHPVLWNMDRAHGRPVRADLALVAEAPSAAAEAAANLLARATADDRS